jgi:hypothetical protein
MRRALCFLTLMCIVAAGQANGIDPFKGPQPIAVLIQTDPWLMVIGSDTPMLTIYDDGQVIYLRRGEEGTPLYVCKQLTQEELEGTKKELAAFGDFSTIKAYYNLAPNITDMPETKIYLSLNSKTMVTSVYGLMATKTQLPAYTVMPGKQTPATLPDSLRNLYDYLVRLKFVDAKPWQPTYIEVMVWGYSYAPDKSIHWPKEWPRLESPDTIKRGDAYSIFLPGADIAKLRSFLNTRKEKGAVEIGGKKWAVAYRYAFPSEPVWMRAFRQNE